MGELWCIVLVVMGVALWAGNIPMQRQKLTGSQFVRLKPERNA